MSSVKSSSRTLLIDLDGTILDIQKKYQTLHKEIADTCGLEATEPQLYWRLRRQGLTEQVILERQNTDAVKIKAYLMAWRERIEEPSSLVHDTLLLPLPILAAAAERETLILVTMRRNAEALANQLAALGIAGLFRGVLSRGMTSAQGKNITSKTMLIKELLPLAAQDVMVGDTEEEWVCSQACGIQGALVATGLSDVERIASWGVPAECVFPSLETFLQRL